MPPKPEDVYQTAAHSAAHFASLPHLADQFVHKLGLPHAAAVLHAGVSQHDWGRPPLKFPESKGTVAAGADAEY